MTTYPSTPSVTAGAVEQSSLTVSTLFDLHANGLYRLALAMLHEADAAQDVVQDTFVRLIAHLEGGGTLPNARGWLYTVAAHACRDRQRRLGRWLPWIAERDTRQASETPEIGDAAGIRATSVGRLLARALDRLQAQLAQRR